MNFAKSLLKSPLKRLNTPKANFRKPPENIPPNVFDKNTLKARVEGNNPPLPQMPDFKVGNVRRVPEFRKENEDILNFDIEGLQVSPKFPFLAKIEPCK